MDYFADDDHSDNDSRNSTTRLPKINTKRTSSYSKRKPRTSETNRTSLPAGKRTNSQGVSFKPDRSIQLGHKSSSWTCSNAAKNHHLDLPISHTTILPCRQRTSSIKSGQSAGSTSNRKVMLDVSDVASQSTRRSARMYPTDDSFSTNTEQTLEQIEEASLNLKNWRPPKISNAAYDSLQRNLLNGMGKFKDQMLRYWRLEKKPWEDREESDDDGYDTDINEHLGFELLADEKARAILNDGEHPEYKQDCRKFRSNPISYFLRHCLEDEICMRHRYLSKGDSITVSNQIKNHLTLASIDLEDNNIGGKGAKYFKNILLENKHLTELNLSCNNLGPVGAKQLASALATNCYLLKLDLSGNKFGDKGGKYCAKLLSENVNLQQLILSDNSIGDVAGVLIAQALEDNVSLKVLDVSWNNLRLASAKSFAECLKKNTELQIFLAAHNGFGDEGAKAMIQTLRQNCVIKELDLSSNRLTSSVIQALTSALNEIEALHVLHLAGHVFDVKHVLDFLSALLASSIPLRIINIDGTKVTPELKGLTSALHVVHNIRVLYSEPPSQRMYTEDDVTWNLTMLCEFMEAAEIEVEDLMPDYEDYFDCDYKDQMMLTMKEALTALYRSDKIRPNRMKKLRAKLKGDLDRKFLISEWAMVYDLVNCGKDPMQEMPLRTHLRRSIAEEREEERIKQEKKNKKTRYGGMGTSSIKSF